MWKVLSVVVAEYPVHTLSYLTLLAKYDKPLTISAELHQTAYSARYKSRLQAR